MLNYAQITSPSLNVRKAPSLSAARWNAPWPINRIALVSPSTPDWYETTYRGQQAFISAKYVLLLPDPVPSFIPDRLALIATHELGCTNSIYFNGYGGKWCHRFADWLVMHAGMPKERVPDVGGCGWGIVWFVRNNRFYFKGEAHKRRMISGYPEIRFVTPPSITPDEESYHPVIADYIYFRWSSADPSVNVSHVGIVRSVEETTLTTFEGNVGKKVVSRDFKLDDSRIVGYGHPDYPLAA